MAAWAKSVTSIIQYLSLVVDHEEKLSASLAVCFEDLDSAIEPGKGFHEAELSRAIFQSISQAQTNVNRERMQWASMIKEQLIPILSELLVQIKRKAADTEREWVGLDYSLMQDMDTWSRLSGSVRKALVGKQWGEGAGGQPSSQDPWLANQALLKHVSLCSKKQAEYKKRLLAQQESFYSFEKVVMQNIRVTLSSFFEYRSTLFSDQLETANALKLELSKIDTDSDWSLFKASHNGRFVEPGDPEFTLKNLSYDGHDDPSVRSVKEGPLFRKEGVIVRGYKPVYGVLTASGYLHLTPPLSGEYPDNPELSLDLTECQLQPLMMNEKEPEEISFLTQGGIFGGEKKHKIKGKGMADSAEWWGALNEQIRKQGKRQPRTLDTEPAISVSNSKIVTSPTETNTASQNPSKPNLPSRNQSDLMGFETPPPAPSEHESELHYNQTSPTAHSTDPTYHDPPPANASVINSAEPSNQFADLALADQMELALKMKTSSNTAPQSSGNPWDSFQADTPDW